MHERTGTRPGISPLCLALVTLAGAIFLNTAPYIRLLTNAPKFDKPATIAETPLAPHKAVAGVMARAELQSTKQESATTSARVRPREESMGAEAEALPLPPPAPQPSATLTFTAPPLPVLAPKRARSVISRSDAPLPTRAPKEVRSRIAGSTLQQIGRASWYSLDSPTASGEKMDDDALTAAHNFLPFGTKVHIENIANGRSVVVRINDRGPFAAGRIIDLSKAAAEALDIMAAGVADVRLSVIYDTVASAGGG
jgi:peptidoglycan lytic transglycosylase